MLGILNIEQPPYKLIKKFEKFEIRQYNSMNLVFTNQEGDSKGFRLLASYIGVWG